MKQTIFAMLVLTLSVLTNAKLMANEKIIFRDVRVFDGKIVLEKATVVVLNDTIQSVAAEFNEKLIVDRASIVDGRGMTLLPGLIDAHTHVFSRAMLKRSLDFGVTTSIDMFMLNLSLMTELHQEQNKQSIYNRADLISAGLAITATGGHGTQFSEDLPTLSIDDNAEAFVAKRIAEGSQFIKLIVDDFSVVGMKIPTLSTTQVKAVVDATHKKGKLAVVHARDLEGYLAALNAKADGIVHGLSESLPSGKLLELMRQQSSFIIPTLTATESTMGGKGGQAFAKSKIIGPMLSEREKTGLSRTRFKQPRGKSEFSVALQTVIQMHKNGSTILAGSDAPNPGTTHGASIHRELELLVEAGLTPLEALKAATSNSAEAFGLSNRGYIMPGKRADLLLVEGNPTVTITDTRKIKGVWKAGERIQQLQERAAIAD